MKKISIGLICLAFICSSFTSDLSSAKIKTLFVFNFIKFVEWEQRPETTKIGFIGEDDQMFIVLSDVAKQKSIGDKEITVEKINNPKTATNYHLIYITESASNNLSKLPNLKNTIIVSEKEGLAKKGSYINFITIDGKLKFEVNRAKFEQSTMKISSQILSLAIIV